jgi:hypothetical protein
MPTEVWDSDHHELAEQEVAKGCKTSQLDWDWEMGSRLQEQETERAEVGGSRFGGGIVQGSSSQTFSSKDLFTSYKLFSTPNRWLMAYID